MNSLELNCTAAMIAWLNTSALLAAVQPRQWDDSAEAIFPRLTVQATQGEEVVWNYGAYRLAVEVKYACAAKSNTETADPIKAELDRLVMYEPEINEQLTTDHFYCYGKDGNSSTGESSGENRLYRYIISILGFDLDRFAD